MDFVEKGFAQASDASKQLITLATAVIAFCVTVVNVKVAEPTFFTPTSSTQKVLLAVCWLGFVVSIGAGVWTQLAITHVLSLGTTTSPSSPWGRKITIPLIIQIVSFVAGTALLALYGVIR